jgi:hypothetical protein
MSSRGNTRQAQPNTSSALSSVCATNFDTADVTAG